MSIEVIPTGAALGAEIRGVDLARPIDDKTFAAIERAYNDHAVIFFRDQHITPSQQVAFTRRFGEIEFNIFGERWSVPGSPEIVVVSNVTEDQLREAEAIVPIVSVQNRFNVTDRHSQSLIDLCEQEDMVFLPWAPIQQTDRRAAVAVAAERRGVTERQLVLAWLLASSPAILPIPGTGSPQHAEENVAAVAIELSPEEMRAINTGG